MAQDAVSRHCERRPPRANALTRNRRIVQLGLLATALAVVAAWRLEPTYDLAYFLPEPANEAQRVLIDRLGQGPGAQTIFVALPKATAAEADDLAQRLRRLPTIRRVHPQAVAFGIAAIPPLIWRHRFLLADLPNDEAEWRGTLAARLVDAELANSEDMLDLIAADPLLASVGAMEHFADAAPSYEYDGERYLVVQTTVPAFDIGGQTGLVARLRELLGDAGFAHARLYGSGVYGAELQAAVRREATLFSALASVALACLLFWRFRSAMLVAAIGMPMFTGAAAGLCALALVYAKVHGIVLAFGFTLLGVVVDYPLHLYSHPSTRNAVWPTLWIGVASTLLAYAAFLLGGATGIAQLGLFAIVGTAVAALGAAWLVPASAFGVSLARPGTSPPLRHWPWIAVLLLAAPLVLLRTPFSDDLAVLTPVPKATLAADAELRRRMGSSDMGHMILVHGRDLDAALVNTERVAERLDAAVEAAELAGYTSIVPLLPSRARQQRRQTALRKFADGDGAYGDGGLASAANAVGFAVGAFRPFHDASLAAAAQEDWLAYEDLRTTPELKLLADSHLLETDDAWISLVFLRGASTDSAAIGARLATLEDVELLDLKEASRSLLASFRERLLLVLSCAAVLIGALLLLLTRSFDRTIWLLGTIAAAVLASTGLGAWLRGGLSLFELVALALVAGLGLDYGLFSSRTSSDAVEAANTGRAVLICALSSTLVFGILAFSTTPALHRIGTTVAVGVAVAYLLVRFGRGASEG